MPRPKVRPEDRQRSLKACLPCQASKIRCDAQTPCISCVRRNKSAACEYNSNSRRSRPSRVRRNREVRFASFSSSPSTGPAAPSRPAREHRTPDENGDERTNSDSEAINTATAPSVQSPECTESRLLLSSKGEKVYIGETSSLSFLQFLRAIMKQYMGPSSFTENGRLNIMLEADTNVNRNVTFEESLAEKEDLVRIFFQACSGFLDLFDKDDIYRLLQAEGGSSRERGLNKESLAILYIVIAIGGQCRGSSQFDLQYASKYFAKGQQYAFEGMLRDPTINMIRAFLLMGFYMLGACHRNAAYMYLGVASKAAAALGLHISKQDQGLSKEELSTRWRTFKSLRVFDLVVSFLLGRSTSSIAFDDSKHSPWQNDSPSHSVAVSAAYRGSALLEEIVQHLKMSNNSFDISTAERFLQRLRQWIHGLPRDFRQIYFDAKEEDISVVRETAIGNIHVSCIYYFAIILTTRSFLISHLMSRLKESSIIAPNFQLFNTGNSGQHSTSPHLAHVCISAATYMAIMCEKAMLSGLLLSNMCIMKAWVFAAGLILGFSLFAYDDAESRGDTESAFQSSRHVLRNLANLSPQAKHYDEILTSFAEAIVRHRQQTSSVRQRTADRYIDCVLDIDVDVVTPIRHRQESLGFISSGSGSSGYPDTWNPLTPQTAAATQMSQSSAPGLGADNGNSDDRHTAGEPVEDADIAVSVDLDGFNVLPFDDAGGFQSVDYEPFGLLLDGI